MKKITRQLQDATVHVCLDASERALMRERLVEYMEYRPIRSQHSHANAIVHRGMYGLKRFASFRALFHMRHVSGALVIALIVTTGTFGVTSAATAALPGDFLYPVKVGVNEEVVTMFKTDNESRLLWDRERAERRLTEASQLASEGRLDDRARVTVEKLFIVHSEAVVEKVKEVEAEDPVRAAELSDEFEQALDTHEAVLARLIVEKDAHIESGAQQLMLQVKSAALEAGKVRESAEGLIADDSEDVSEGGEVSAAVMADGIGASSSEQALAAIEERALSSAVRERAAGRARQRAEEHLREAEAVLQSLGNASELAAQARDQIRAGEDVMVVAGDLVIDGKLKQAYRQYRAAGAIFQKVAQLGRATKQFDVQMSLSTPVDLPVAGTTGPDLAESPSDEETGEEADRENVGLEPAPVATLDELESNASSSIAAVQTLLANHADPTTLDATIHERATTLLKDAYASYLRAQVARGSGDENGARMHFRAAESQADEAGVRFTGIGGGSVESVHVATSTDTSIDNTQGTTTEKNATQTIYHTYENGAHVYTGALIASSSCHTIVGHVEVGESLPESLTLVLVANVADVVEDCAEAQASKTFEASIPASAEATTSRLRINGIEESFTLIEGRYGVEVSIPATSTEQASVTGDVVENAAGGIIRRAFERTQEMFIGQ